MWTRLAHNVLKYRLFIIILLGTITVYMAYLASTVEYSYNYAKIVPSDDPDMVFFEEFKSTFGEDGNILALGIKDSALYQLDNFYKFSYLANNLERINGVNQVVSLTNLNQFVKDPDSKTFLLQPLINELPNTQKELDSLLLEIRNEKFYTEQLLNTSNGATFIAVTIDKEILNTKYRDVTIGDIKHLTSEFEDHTGIDVHHVGLPYIRSEVNGKIKAELQLFLLLSLALSALILLFFFRSWDAVVFPLIIVVTVVIWSMGTLAIFGYEITMVTGLMPPIIAVIGIPNSIYLLNKYHQEISKHGNKGRALSFVIRKIGLVTLITNFTTAIGFLVLAFTNIAILKEFGLVASINIMAAFFVSTTLIPAVFSYLPTPHGKQLKHLKFWVLEKILTYLDLLVHRHRYSVFTITGIITAIALV
ncbi:MAG TPA: MMPL family transporter, partial [Mariniflexile sp.]